jgi:nodulation protein E
MSVGFAGSVMSPLTPQLLPTWCTATNGRDGPQAVMATVSWGNGPEASLGAEFAKNAILFAEKTFTLLTLNVTSERCGKKRASRAHMAESGASRRVVVTGMGVVTPIGQTVADFWAGLKQGKSGVGSLDRFPQNEPHVLLPSQIKDFDLKILIAAQIKGFEPKARLKHFKRDKLILHADRYSLFAAAAADEAVRQAGLKLPFEDPYRAACIIGSAAGGVMNLEIGYRYLFALKQPAAHPMSVLRTIGSSAAAHVGIECGVKGPTFATCSACATATHAIALGRDFIRAGLVDVAIVGASEAPHTYGAMRAWQATRLLSPDGIFPFAKRRNGTVLGEGAGVLVLESTDHAKARGAKLLAELCGIGMTADSKDMIGPGIEGPSAAMRCALKDAQLAPTDIDYLNAHGTATRVGDRNETKAIHEVFGKHAHELAVSSTKSMYGHPLGASGGIEAVACIKAMEESWMPPTLGLDEADPECDLDYIANVGRSKKLNYTMSNSFAFTGLNAVVIFGPAPA